MNAQTPARSRLTLIECCVVIGIIAILAALFLPVLSKAKGRRQAIQCEGNLNSANSPGRCM